MKAGDRIARERADQKLTQQALADKVTRLGRKITQTGINKIETRGSERPLSLPEIAKALGVTEEWLRTGKGQKYLDASQKPELSVIRDPMSRVRVVGLIQGGYWAEPDEDRAPKDEYIDAPLPEIYRTFRKFGLRVEGNSMNLLYPAGTLLVCASLYELHEEEPIAGRKYIVERIRPDGRREATVKEAQKDVHGKWWLWPRSNDPEHQEPIPFDAVDGDTVQVQARVIYSFKPE